jgi:polysaccharide export outer membrane protein
MTHSPRFSRITRPAFLFALLAALSLAAGCGSLSDSRETPSSLVMGAAAAGAGGGTAAPGGAAPAESKHATVDYRLGPGDQLQVAVFGQQDLSGKFEVDGGGNLLLPLIGQLHAEGRTVSEVQEAITKELDKNFVANPKVNVQVLNYRPFYILGEVNKPGSYPYVVGINVRQAVAIAGGYTRRARSSPVQIIRSGGNAADAAEATPDDPVLPGDTIQVDRRLF